MHTTYTAITPRNQVPELAHLTGAAARSADAADETAARLQAEMVKAHEALVLAAAQVVELPSATNLAIGFTAIAEAQRTRDAFANSTVPRHANKSEHYARPTSVLSGGYWCPKAAIQQTAVSQRSRLTSAGVPMPPEGTYTPEYWHDAAARGC